MRFYLLSLTLLLLVFINNALPWFFNTELNTVIPKNNPTPAYTGKHHHHHHTTEDSDDLFKHHTKSHSDSPSILNTKKPFGTIGVKSHTVIPDYFNTPKHLGTNEPNVKSHTNKFNGITVFPHHEHTHEPKDHTENPKNFNTQKAFNTHKAEFNTIIPHHETHKPKDHTVKSFFDQ